MIPSRNSNSFSFESNQPKMSGRSRGAESFLLRNGSAPVHNLMEGTLKLENLTHGAGSDGIEAVVMTAEPGVSCWEGKLSDAGKWYHILEGTLEIIANDVSHVLGEGDSLYLDSAIPHIWRNPGDRAARALVISSSPTISANQAGATA